MIKELRNKLNLIVLFFVAAIIPLVVKLKIVPVNIEEYTLIRNSAQIADVFSYCKSNLIILSCALIFIIYFIYFLSTPEKINFSCVKKPVFYLPAIFLFFVIISALLSNYPLSSFFGISERYEGLFVLISYIIFFAATLNCCKTENNIKFIFYALLFSAVFILLIGLSQFFDNDFLISDIGKKFLLFGYEDLGVNIKPIFDTSYSTLYNPNCLGLYCAMIFPIMLMATFFFRKNLFIKYLCLSITILSVINLFASNSTGGLIGIIAATFFMTVISLIYTIKNKKHVRKILLSLSGIIILCAAIIFLTPIKNNFCDMLSKFIVSKQDNFFTDLKMSDNDIEISYDGGKIKLEYANSKINLYENDKLLQPKNIQTVHEAKSSPKLIYDYDSKTLDNLQVTIENEKLVILKLENIKLVLGINQNKLLLLSNKGQIIDINKPIEQWGFKNHELFASSRGYIWSRSIPLIKENIFIGSGPDTFVFSFPQNDIVGKLKFHDSPCIIVDKPHNFYIQTIINTGLISLLILLSLFGYYFFITLRFLMTKNKFSIIQLGLSSGIFGYLISCLATDSVVSVAPIFWIILGLSFAINFFKESV